MSLSPAQRHTARVQAERKLERQQALAGWDSLHLQVQAMERDIRRLRELPRTADRIAMKRDELLPRWLPTVENYLAEGEVYANPIFAWCVIWLFDVGDFDKALDWADLAIAQRQQTPDRLKRSFAAFVADTVLTWADEEASRGESLEPYFSRTFANVRDNWRLHEEISAKWFKFAGLMLLRDDNGQPLASAVEDVATLKQADALLAQAQAFNPRGAGVKTQRQRIAARLRALEKE
ncbi:phage terminase small subunit [Serratia marcescens]|uniref:phage terminase small subunit n=1 Tax=Serratia TaxID=613 RepID=UPI0027760563|nr:phage terminase small subunit [Serratia marcescens]MDP8703784.1 phage terminase small subunit [Serratia marcescens]